MYQALFSPPTHEPGNEASFVVVKTGLANHYRCWVDNHLQKNGLGKAFNGHFGRQKCLAKLLQSLNKLCAVLLNLYMHSSCFAVVKMYLHNIHKPSTGSSIGYEQALQ